MIIYNLYLDYLQLSVYKWKVTIYKLQVIFWIVPCEGAHHGGPVVQFLSEFRHPLRPNHHIVLARRSKLRLAVPGDSGSPPASAKAFLQDFNRLDEMSINFLGDL